MNEYINSQKPDFITDTIKIYNITNKINTINDNLQLIKTIKILFTSNIIFDITYCNNINNTTFENTNILTILFSDIYTFTFTNYIKKDIIVKFKNLGFRSKSILKLQFGKNLNEFIVWFSSIVYTLDQYI